MKRLILLFALLLSCVSLCRYAYPPVPVVYGFLTDEYMDPNPAGIAGKQLLDYLHPEGYPKDCEERQWYCYPDWYGGRYVSSIEGKRYLVIKIVYGHSYMEDEIHAIMAETEKAGYGFEYVPVSYREQMVLWQRYEERYTEELQALVMDAIDRGIKISALGIHTDDMDNYPVQIRYTIETDCNLIEIVGLKNYLKYLLDPHIVLMREPYTEKIPLIA